ncbi:MAG TPA: hypothetical protein VFM25_14675, partial [Verrucomicrobiae bacterium]|nr:hypothetical protein [Verrucomicrobiae bacterium]
MNFNSRIKAVSISSLCGGLILSFALVGCDRDAAVKVRTVPKESVSVQSPESPGISPETMPADDFHSGATQVQPQLKWTLPDGWTEKPLTEFRVASFNAQGKNGEVADVCAIPLPATGREVDLVNMWRGQMHLPTVTDADAAKGTEAVKIGSEQGKLFDIASTEKINGKERGRMLIAMITRGGTSWFFKMTGEASFVSAEKPVFLQFLKSVSFEAAEPMNIETASAQAASTPVEVSEKNSAEIPADWKEVPPGEFLIAKYMISGADGAEAQVNVSVLAGEGGGLLANANRWRRQLGLKEVDETELAQQMTTMNVGDNKAIFLDMTGVDAKTGKPSRL